MRNGLTRTPERRRRGRRSAVLAFVSLRLLMTAGALGSVLVVGSPAGQACASGARHAALVIATGERTLRHCVALDGTSVSAIHVIELAHVQDGLEYRLGFGGQAVCELDGVGTASGDCFSDYPNFWGFWLGDGSGGWSWSGSGAASTPMHDGDVEGWSWGSGSSGATHSPPPATTLASVCGTIPPPPTPTVSPPHGSASPASTPAARGANATPGDAGDTGGVSSRSVGPSRVVVTPTTATTSGDPPVAAAATPPSGGGGGPPPGAIVAIAAAGILGLAGWWRIRGGASSGSNTRGRW